LAKANRDIAHGERRMAERRILIGRMGSKARTRLLLRNSLETRILEQGHVHRRLIVEALRQGETLVEKAFMRDSRRCQSGFAPPRLQPLQVY
jgi:hypothetical protein